MPKTTKEVELWKGELDLAMEVRKKYLTHWNYWERVYDDDAFGQYPFFSRPRRTKQNDPDYVPQINELESIILSILPRILYFKPVFEITPTIEDYRFSAMVYELLATVLYEQLNLEGKLEEIALDALIIGSGVHKAGFWYEVGSTEYQLGDATTGDPEVHDENVFSGHVSPKDMLYDYRVKAWEDKRWIAEELIKPVTEVKKNNVYKGTSDLTGNITFTKDLEGVAFKERFDKKGDLVRLWEIHDLENSKIITVADGHNKLLRKDDDYGFELYDELRFTPTRPKRFWGKSLAQSIEEHIIRLAKTAHYMDSHGKKAGLTKVLFDKGRVDKKAQQAMRSSRDFELVAVEDLLQGVPIQELKFSNVGADFFALFNIIQDTSRYLSGVTQQERGQHEAGVETAFEVAKLAEASDIRNKWRIKKLNNFISSVTDKVLRIASENFHTSKICAMVGLPPEYGFLLLPYDKMKLRVKFGSTAAQAKQEQLQRIMTFVQIGTMAGLQINPEGLAKLLSEALDLELRENMLLMGGDAGAGGAAGTRPPAASAFPGGTAMLQGGM